MKKILIILSALLVTLSACGKASYNDVVTETNETFTKISKDRDYKFLDLEDVKEENIKEFNDVLTEEKWIYKNLHRFEISTTNDETQNSKVWITIYEIEGDISTFPNTYCTVDQVAVYYNYHNITTAEQDTIKKDMNDLCKSIGAEIKKEI